MSQEIPQFAARICLVFHGVSKLTAKYRKHFGRNLRHFLVSRVNTCAGGQEHIGFDIIPRKIEAVLTLKR
jgi:hypothetical protein